MAFVTNKIEERTMNVKQIEIYESEIISSLENLNNNLNSIEHELRGVMQKVKVSPKVELDEIFITIERLQTLLAKVSFKWNIPLSAYLNKIVKDFDRIDNEEQRRVLIEEIKRGVFD